MFINLHNHSRYSWDCISNIKDIVSFAKNNGQSAIALTDHGNMNGAVELYKECKKQEIKPIIGNELYICQNGKSSLDKNSDNRKLDHLVVLAKNDQGYRNLIKLTSLANHSDRYYYKPRIDKDLLSEYGNGLIIINGHIGTSLSHIFMNEDLSLCETPEDARDYLNHDYKEKFNTEAKWFHERWGDDFYVECQLFDPGDIFQQSLGTFLFELANEFGYKSVGTGDAHYITSADQPYHKTFVCIKQNTKYSKANPCRYLDAGTYGLVTNELAQKYYPLSLVEATNEIADKVQDYDILKPERIPNFPVLDKTQTVKDLCEKEIGVKCPDTLEYRLRLQEELRVFKLGDLEGYLLIVRDYIEWAESQGILVGTARGSSAGSLACYLMGITKIDPIPFNLLFERFHSEDRAAAKQLADIDTDFQADRGDEVKEYIKNKYGEDNVAGLITFNLLKGKSALKDVMRIHNAADHTTLNKITEAIPSDAAISDKLADFKKKYKSGSVLLYCLIEDPESLSDYCRYDVETGEFSGEFGDYFKLAIGLEGAIKSESKHPCALLISDEPIVNNAPLAKDKNSDDLICAYDGHFFGDVSLVKFDILRISTLSKLQEVNKIIKEVGIEIGMEAS